MIASERWKFLYHRIRSARERNEHKRRLLS